MNVDGFLTLQRKSHDIGIMLLGEAAHFKVGGKLDRESLAHDLFPSWLLVVEHVNSLMPFRSGKIRRVAFAHSDPTRRVMNLRLLYAL